VLPASSIAVIFTKVSTRQYGHDQVAKLFLGHHERIPYDGGTMRSVYHIREYNVRRLSLVSAPHLPPIAKLISGRSFRDRTYFYPTTGRRVLSIMAT
jgi:hypothetical protein